VRYLYDGSFEGFLCVVGRLRDGGGEPEEIVSTGNNYQESLLAEKEEVAADPVVADKVSTDIRMRISLRAFRHLCYAFLSRREGVETELWRYLRLGWEVGGRVDGRHAEECVQRVHKASRAVGRERHYQLCYLRFRQLDTGVFYAPMEPEFDVLCLVAPHFARRMSGRDLMIHDLKREAAVLCREGEMALVEAPPCEPRLTGEETFYQDLWRDYFQVIAVPDRYNPRLQASNMPRKYWRYLIEQPRTTKSSR
jgi:probable DNA metabolism protein